MKNTIRAFIAIEMTDHVRDTLLQVQTRLRESGADVKWSEPENIHLTLKFLGDIPVQDVEAISGIMEQTVKGIPPFPILVSELGAFPDILLPKIIWAGITQGQDKLLHIAERLETGLTRLKIKKEDRKFTAHITLGRTRSLAGKDKLYAALEETNIPNDLKQSVDHLSLVKSELTPHGSVYTTLKKITL